MMLQMNTDYIPNNLKETGPDNKLQLLFLGGWNWMFVRSLDKC